MGDKLGPVGLGVGDSDGPVGDGVGDKLGPVGAETTHTQRRDVVRVCSSNKKQQHIHGVGLVEGPVGDGVGNSVGLNDGPVGAVLFCVFFVDKNKVRHEVRHAENATTNTTKNNTNMESETGSVPLLSLIHI